VLAGAACFGAVSLTGAGAAGAADATAGWCCGWVAAGAWWLVAALWPVAADPGTVTAGVGAAGVMAGVAPAPPVVTGAA
jgi:hypothetical protein